MTFGLDFRPNRARWGTAWRRQSFHLHPSSIWG